MSGQRTPMHRWQETIGARPRHARTAWMVALAAAVAAVSGCPGVDPVGSGSGGENLSSGSPLTRGFEAVDVTVEGRGTVAQDGIGTAVTLTAVPEEGWRFDGWVNLPGTGNPLTVSADHVSNVGARFVADADGDGVADEQDACPSTPADQAVDAAGCGTFERDADADGIQDVDDSCPDSPPGASVDEQGCAQPQRDDDGDGVPNGADGCSATPKSESVDDTGCSSWQRDTDQDGVVDALDRCPGTGMLERADDDGCGASQRDTDGDGVNDAYDRCPRTPEGEDVDDRGCGASQLDSDYDGVSDDADECPDSGAGAFVDRRGCLIEFEYLGNDACANAADVVEGQYYVTNEPATNDGPDAGACNPFESGNPPGVEIGADIWFCYTATCTETVSVSLCDSPGTDTTMVVYDGCSCPPTQSLVCDDDFCGPGAGSVVGFSAQAGHSYLIRVGGWLDEGSGTAQRGRIVLDVACFGDEDRDSDGDGVPDSRDACPNTPPGADVDSRGCPDEQPPPPPPPPPPPGGGDELGASTWNAPDDPFYGEEAESGFELTPVVYTIDDNGVLTQMQLSITEEKVREMMFLLFGVEPDTVTVRSTVPFGQRVQVFSASATVPPFDEQLSFSMSVQYNEFDTDVVDRAEVEWSFGWVQSYTLRLGDESYAITYTFDGGQTGTLGTNDTRIVWDTITGTLTYRDEYYEEQETIPLDEIFGNLGSWSRR